MRRVNILTGALTTVAGNNAAGPGGDGGLAAASSTSACGSAVDAAGNLAITSGVTVRLVAARTGTFYGQKMTAGHIYTVVGNSSNQRIPPVLPGFTGGPTGDGGPAAKAYLGSAADVTFDGSGNMLIADSGAGQGCSACSQVGALLRVVAARTGSFYGVTMKAGHIYSIAGKDVGPAPKGNGGPAAGAWLGPGLSSAELDRHGNIILAGAYQPPGQSVPFDVVTPYVRVIAKATGTFYGQKMKAGHIYQVAGDSAQGPYVNAVPGTKTSLWAAGGAVADLSGNLVIGDGPEARVVAGRSGRFYGQNMKAGYIYRIGGSPTGGYSGDGGPAVRALLNAGPIGLDRFGNAILGQMWYRVRVIAARTGRFYGQKMTAGHIYTVAGNGSVQSGNGGPPRAAEFISPNGIGVSARGDIAFITFPFSSTLQVIPARSGMFFGRNMTAGRLYTVAVGGGKFNLWDDLWGDSPLAFDGKGNILVAEASDPYSNHVWVVAATTGTFYGRKMTAGGTYRIAGASGQEGFSGDGGPALNAKLDGPNGTAVDHHGNVVIADSFNFRLRVLAATTGSFYGIKMTAGDIYTVAGGGSSSGDGVKARAAAMWPVAVAVDAAGNLIMTDGSSQRVRVVAAATGTFYGQAMTAGDIYTIAGNGTSGFSGNGGPATSAEFKRTDGVAVDRHGNVIFADGSDKVVWVIAVRSGTFYGRAMTAGHIYIVAGGGTRVLGDGGPATKAMLAPVSVAVSATGSLLVTDDLNSRVRAVAP
jgi:hypothetical protein